MSDTMELLTDPKQVKAWLKLLNKDSDFMIQADGSVNVRGNVDITQATMGSLSHLPVQFNEVTGNFICNSCTLTSLKGCPRKVDGCFSCSISVIKSLEYAPQHVGGDFCCSFTDITSLQYIPSHIGRDLYCTSTDIKNFEHVQHVGGSFICGRNNSLVSLKGLPTIIHGDLQVSECPNLTSLQGGPEEVKGDFEVWGCKLTSLENGPKRVGGNYGCLYNGLTTLNGAPDEVDIFNCSSNRLTSLEGGPKRVRRHYVCENNPLTAFSGLAAYIGGDLHCKDTHITTFKSFPPEIDLDGSLFMMGAPIVSLDGLPRSLRRRLKLSRPIQELEALDVAAGIGNLDVDI